MPRPTNDIETGERSSGSGAGWNSDRPHSLADDHPPPADLRPVAFVSQLGTSSRSSASQPLPDFDPRSLSIPATETQETHPEFTGMPSTPSTTTKKSTLTAPEMGQGDAGRTARRQPPEDEEEDPPGAVGGAPPPSLPNRPSSSSSSSSSARVPLLHIPHLDPSLLREPLRPQFDDDRPLSPPVPVAQVEDQANQIIQGFFEERWRQESADGRVSGVGELVVPTPMRAPTTVPESAADAADGDSPAASMMRPSSSTAAASSSSALLHPDAARFGGASPSSHPGPDKIRAVSSKLCQIAAEMDQRYSVEFDDMIDFMKLNGSSAYDAFAEVAKQLLSDKITWGKVITLLALGYRMAKRVIDLAIPNFVQDVISYLVTFISRYLAKWIADRGGWLAILNLEEGISWAGVFSVMGVGCLTLAALSWVKNR